MVDTPAVRAGVMGASVVGASVVGVAVGVGGGRGSGWRVGSGHPGVVTPLLCERSYRQRRRVSMYARVGCGWVGGRMNVVVVCVVSPSRRWPPPNSRPPPPQSPLKPSAPVRECDTRKVSVNVHTGRAGVHAWYIRYRNRRQHPGGVMTDPHWAMHRSHRHNHRGAAVCM